MVVRCGISIIANDRFLKLREKFGDKGLERLFFPEELEYIFKSVRWTERCAARFAAKCACFQALNWAGLRDYRLIEVKKDTFGAPYIALYGRALGHFQQLGASRVHVTLTHSDQYSIANVLLE